MSRSVTKIDTSNNAQMNSHKSLYIKENKDDNNIDSHINTIMTSSKKSKLIEKESGEFNISYSQLMQIAEINPELEKSGEIVDKDSPMDIDLSSLEFETIMKSQMKNSSPSAKRNLNIRNINLNISDKRIINNVREQITTDSKNKKFRFNMPEGFEIPEEDLKAMFENILSQSEKKGNDKDCHSVENFKRQISNNEVNLVLKQIEQNNVPIAERNLNLVSSSCTCNSNNPNVIIPIIGFFLEEFKKFFSDITDKFKQELIKIQSNNLVSSNINTVHSNKPGSDYNTNLKTIPNRSLNQNFNKSSSTTTTQISPPSNVNMQSNIKPKQREATSIEDLDFDNNLNNIRSTTLKNNNLNNSSFKPNPTSSLNVNPFTKGSDNKIAIVKTSQKAKENRNPLEDMEINLKEYQDDEFDTFMKNKQVSFKDMPNEFAKGKIAPSNKNTNNIFNNNKVKENVNNTNNIKNEFQVKNKSNNNLLESNTKVGEPVNIEDDEFDNFFSNANKKKANAKSFNAPKLKTSKEEMVQSDFISGNSKVAFKANPKVNQLMKEMDGDYEDEFAIKEENNEKKEKNKKVINNIKPVEKVLQNSNAQNKKIVPPSNKQFSSTKKFKINDYSSEKLNSKRLYSEHLKSMDPEEKTKVLNSNIQINNKKFKSNQPFKIIDNQKMKFNPPSILNANATNASSSTNIPKPTVAKMSSQYDSLNLNSENPVKLELPIINPNPLFVTNIEICEYHCLCVNDNIKKVCEICRGCLIINKKSFSYAFNYYYTSTVSSASKFQMNKQQEEFLAYQFRLVSWKYYIQSKYQENNSFFCIENIMKLILSKFKIIFEQGKRSLLMKVAEKDSSINRNMILLLLDIKKVMKENSETYLLEMTDGYKSVFSEINSNNPIATLITKNILIPGLKLNIGLAKVERITDNFSIFVSIFYNSLSKADSTSKLGVNQNNKFLIKNLANLREDGGEVSLIDVVILKKYEYHCHDFSKKEKFSANKLQQMLEEYNDSLKRDYDSCQEYDGVATKHKFNSENLNEGVKAINKNKNANNTFPYENLTYVFKLICADSLLYLNLMSEASSSAKNISFKKNLKNKLIKKCVIEFSVKNKEIYESIIQGNRYQIALLNISKNSVQSVKLYNDAKSLKLKANDSVLIKEMKHDKKDNNIHSRIVLESGKLTGVSTDEIDVTDYLMNNSFNCSPIMNEEVSFAGVYLNHSSSKKGEGDKSLYLYFANYNKNLAIIKIHDEQFFDFSKLFKIKTGSNIIYHFKNLNFQIVYYYDNHNTKQLTTYKPERKYDKNYDNKHIVYYMESTNFTTFKMAPSGSKFHFDMNKALQNCTNKLIYNDEILGEIMKCI